MKFLCFMAYELDNNPNLSGANYEIEFDVDQAPSIEGVDYILGAQLMKVVFDEANCRVRKR